MSRGRFGAAILVLWAAVASAANIRAVGQVDLDHLFQTYLVAPHSLAQTVAALETDGARRAFVDRFERRLREWPAPGGAAFALESAAAMYPSEPEQACRILEVGCTRLRRGAPGEFERLWQRASVAMLQGPRNRNDTPGPRCGEEHFRHAQERFPTDPALGLAVSLVKEQGLHELLHIRRVSDVGPGGGSPGFARSVARILADLSSTQERLRQHPEVRAEATLRLGLTRYYQGRLDEALTLWKELDAQPADAEVRYLALLFSGRAWQRRANNDAARRAYARAHDLYPSAQSAIIGLISIHIHEGNMAAAGRLAADALESSDDFDDPWIQYMIGDFEQWPTRRGLVREALR